MELNKKIKDIRCAEDISEVGICKVTGLSLSEIKSLECNNTICNIKNMIKITNNKMFSKYTLWLMTGKIAPEAGQISPAISHTGQKRITYPLQALRVG